MDFYQNRTWENLFIHSFPIGYITVMAFLQVERKKKKKSMRQLQLIIGIIHFSILVDECTFTCYSILFWFCFCSFYLIAIFIFTANYR